jgi:hypothetical protein
MAMPREFEKRFSDLSLEDGATSALVVRGDSTWCGWLRILESGDDCWAKNLAGLQSVEMVAGIQSRVRRKNKISHLDFGVYARAAATISEMLRFIELPNQAPQRNVYVRHGSCLRTLRAVHSHG